MKFKLIVNGSGVHKLEGAIILESLDKELKQNEDYIILEPKMPIDNNIYLQVMFDGEAVYSIETRFMYDDDSFKHYEYSTSDLNEVKDIFLEYFQKGSLSSLSKWNTDLVEDDNLMCKLYKKGVDRFLYVEFWTDGGNSITIHKGRLGEVGATEDIEISTNESLAFHMEKLQSEYKKQGYASIENLSEIIIQYILKPEDEEYELLETLEDEMNQALGWTGNGHCESGDVQGGVISLFCQVVDKRIALNTIIDIFQENEMLLNITISSPNDITEEYEIIYPAE